MAQVSQFTTKLQAVGTATAGQGMQFTQKGMEGGFSMAKGVLP